MKINFNYEQQEENDPGNYPNALSIWKTQYPGLESVWCVDKVFHVDQANLKPNLLPLQSKRWGYKSVPSSLAPIS